MRTLVLGGTGWLGRAIVREHLALGAEVTCLARGESGTVPDGARFVRVDRRHADAYDTVRGAWDEVVELSAAPDLVQPALAALADDAAHWTLVSTVSVYARNDEPGADESAALVDPADPTEYGPGKVAAERSTAARLGASGGGGRLSVVRPGLVVGPGDPSDRFGYWPARLQGTGPVLTPTTAGRFVQVVDVGDLAAWTAAAARTAHVGVVNAVGAAVPMDDFLRTVGGVGGFDGETVAVEDDALLARDVRYWAGPRSLPLWLPRSDAAFAQRSGVAWHAAGGRSRPLASTVAAVLDDERARGVDRPRRSGLTRAEADAVIDYVS